MPSLGVLFGRKRLCEVDVIGEKVLSQRVRDRFATGFVEQLGISVVGKFVGSWSGHCSRIKVVIGQFEPTLSLVKEQCSKANHGFVEAAHIQLLNGRSGRMKREAAERTNFWHQVQEECPELGEKARLFVDVSPFLAVPRIRDVVYE